MANDTFKRVKQSDSLDGHSRATLYDLMQIMVYLPTGRLARFQNRLWRTPLLIMRHQANVRFLSTNVVTLFHSLFTSIHSLQAIEE